ncbi:tripartite tricarboxylate transporter substrate binding protein [Belnapia sp. T18]|uniref:Tripartite tricarboxylate transporter substrate binding protein n=1 Tax=Belnapia arida TaxID=2804533 RepID=A0ABS1U9Z8_9PROT|nr:tripartite tricarboxylate transporter substrate binding protein [Belnapia arida]MBL6080527.1 tripartite tricarboxylate transporter substrate binding protein [Belnapia arida]
MARGQTESYPSRPITIIAPLAAGSAADSLMRDLAQQLSSVLGQPAVVVNRVGAGGNIGTTAIARSAPDGYTLGQVSQGNMVINTAFYRDIGYDPIRDFAPIAVVAAMSNVMVVSRHSPYRSVREVIEAIRAKPPGTVTYSSSGVGTSMHIAGAMFARTTDTELTHIPYTGAPAAMTAIISGDVDTGFFNIPAAKGLLAAGDLRPLAVTAMRRSASLPDLPTLEEAGLQNYDVSTWLGLVAPAGTPPLIIERIHKTLDQILSQPALREKLTTQGFDLPPGSVPGPAEFLQLIQDDLAKWPAILRQAGAKPE